jgi:general L-amino acid transport system substrate-binding protein
MPKLATLAVLGLAGLLALGALPVQAESTLAAVKKHGLLSCGINGQLPGFSVQNDRKEWVGFEIDYCRAVAAAVLGDGRKVGFMPLTTTKRFDALRNGSIDVLMRNTTASLERTARTNVRDAAVIYVDAQSVVVPRRSTSRSWRSSTARRGASCAARPLSRGSRNGSPSASAPSCR